MLKMKSRLYLSRFQMEINISKSNTYLTKNKFSNRTNFLDNSLKELLVVVVVVVLKNHNATNIITLKTTRIYVKNSSKIHQARLHNK